MFYGIGKYYPNKTLGSGSIYPIFCWVASTHCNWVFQPYYPKKVPKHFGRKNPFEFSVYKAQSKKNLAN